jgi:hypothetical protein
MFRLIGAIIVLAGMFFVFWGVVQGSGILVGGGIAIVAYGWKCVRGFPPENT